MKKNRQGVLVGMAFFWLAWGILRTSAFAHEPVFSPGPEVMPPRIWEIETEVEFESGREGNRETELHYKIMAGVTKDWTLGIQAPYHLSHRHAGETERGLGDIMLSTKYNFYRKDLPGAQHKITGLGGIKLPTGNEAKPPDGHGFDGLSAWDELRVRVTQMVSLCNRALFATHPRAEGSTFY